MKIVRPNYYEKFKCIAGDCKHSCCKGWEIDIDSETLNKYRAMTDDLGVLINSNIESEIQEEEEVFFFKLKEEDRCPFLREDNLCELIVQRDESILCDICRDHPRFRSFWTNETDEALGMVCEEAARIILSNKEKVVFEIVFDDGDEKDISQDEEYLYNLRNELLEILQDRSISVDDRILKMMDDCFLESNSPTLIGDKRWDIPFEQLAVYLLMRTLPDALYDDRLEDRIIFVADSYAKIRNEWIESEDQSLEKLIEIARNFSEKVEYNIETWGF